MSVVSAHKPYRVGKSRTGLGLFATKPIKKGTRIIRYTGPMMTEAEAEKADNKYLFEITKQWTIDGSVRSNIARYANHSCRPNAESDVRKKERRVYIRAIKDIQPGDEITYDYGTDYFKIYLKPLGCLCAHCIKKRALKAEKLKAERVGGKKGKAKTSKPKATKAKAKSAKNKAGKTKATKAASASSRTKKTATGSTANRTTRSKAVKGMGAKTKSRKASAPSKRKAA